MQRVVKTLAALAGNRTRASRVAGENSTTEPPMLDDKGEHALTRCHDPDTPATGQQCQLSFGQATSSFE